MPQKSSIQYRKALTEDFDNICKLIKSQEELFLVYPSGKFPLTVDQLKELAEVRKELTVITDGTKIIGFANFYNYRQNESAFIGNVVIDESYRGQGLGKEIVTYMLRQAFDKYHLPEVKISVFSNNSPALLLYSGFGFTPYEIEERKDENGKRVALIHMRIKRNS